MSDKAGGAKQPTGSRPVLQRVRRIIRKALPGAEETISYQIPTYELHGRGVVSFAGWKADRERMMAGDADEERRTDRWYARPEDPDGNELLFAPPDE